MKEQIEWTGKVRNEGSWGATEWEECDMILTVGMREDKTYGWFETYAKGHSDKYYAEGGLWITDNELESYINKDDPLLRYNTAPTLAYINNKHNEFSEKQWFDLWTTDKLISISLSD